ncbi:NifB/NifX family molybdenum-iron cluster-binding protein [Hippea jasoniae]|uniref:NifB/NifX family molybdenum-iron cluster-binding protein n=1 Tax=Hippea jasoniae TaxID=944479 RepID=UPI00055202C5|nr:NifB/NifX family molybdenum-iron cluster-binding protein [Hippea jasoniae]
MKVLLTARGDNLDAKMDERFGRADYFIVYDTDSKEFEAIKNPHINDQGGVGISVAKFVLQKGVDAVVSGSYGPNALDVLRTGDLKLYSTKGGSVKENIELLEEGKLEIFNT